MKDSASTTDSLAMRLLAVIAGWLVPGGGHWILGQRAHGAILFAAITLTFWTGVAVGGVRNSIDPKENRAWFAAQVFCGGHTLGVLALRQRVPDRLPYIIGWPSANVGVVYCGVAGLLNVLALLHVIAWPGLAEPAEPSRAGRREGAS